MNKFLFIFGVLSSLITTALLVFTLLMLLDPWTPKHVLLTLITSTVLCAVCSAILFIEHHRRQVPVPMQQDEPVVTDEEIDRILAAMDDNAPVAELVNQ